MNRLDADKRLDDDNEHRRLDSTKVWYHFWDRLDRLERLDGLNCSNTASLTRLSSTASLIGCLVQRL